MEEGIKGSPSRLKSPRRSISSNNHDHVKGSASSSSSTEEIAVASGANGSPNRPRERIKKLSVVRRTMHKRVAKPTKEDLKTQEDKSRFFRKKWQSSFHKIVQVLRVMKKFRQTVQETVEDSPLQQASKVSRRGTKQGSSRRRTTLSRHHSSTIVGHVRDGDVLRLPTTVDERRCDEDGMNSDDSRERGKQSTGHGYHQGRFQKGAGGGLRADNCGGTLSGSMHASRRSSALSPTNQSASFIDGSVGGGGFSGGGEGGKRKGYIPIAVSQPAQPKQSVGFEFKNAITREMKDEAMTITKLSRTNRTLEQIAKLEKLVREMAFFEDMSNVICTEVCKVMVYSQCSKGDVIFNQVRILNRCSPPPLPFSLCPNQNSKIKCFSCFFSIHFRTQSLPFIHFLYFSLYVPTRITCHLTVIASLSFSVPLSFHRETPETVSTSS